LNGWCNTYDEVLVREETVWLTINKMAELFGATRVLREFITRGFALDDERLKQGGTLFGKDYFDELLESIREIRASERRFYQKISDIYAECSIDYDPKAETT